MGHESWGMKLPWIVGEPPDKPPTPWVTSDLHSAATYLTPFLLYARGGASTHPVSSLFSREEPETQVGKLPVYPRSSPPEVSEKPVLGLQFLPSDSQTLKAST